MTSRFIRLSWGCKTGSCDYQLRRKLGDTDKPLSCELRLLKRNDAPVWAHLVVVSVNDDDGGSELRSDRFGSRYTPFAVGARLDC